MSNKEEEIRKQLDRERADRKRAEELALFEQEEANKNQLAAEQGNEESVLVESPFVVKPTPSNHATDDWKKILSKYQEAYPEQTIKDNCLMFASKDEAIAFFQRMADSKLQFFVQELVGGKPSGFHCYSCGNGQLFSGSLEAIHQQLQQASEKNPSPELDAGLAFMAKYLNAHSTSNFRSVLNEQREGQADEPDATKQSTPALKN